MGDPNRELLVSLLHEAAQVEHGLLCAYLYAAYSLKTLPEEFVSGPQTENPRRALQFETVRSWKQSILMAAREEMRHLHYVQSLLRLLGERAWFVLPPRNTDGNWVLGNWREKVFDKGFPEPEAVEIPITSLDHAQAFRFLMYESGEWLQEANPAGPRLTGLFDQLFDLESQLHIEQIVQSVDDPSLQGKLRQGLGRVYKTSDGGGTDAVPVGPSDGSVLLELLPQFTSITDLYVTGILPLFREAFEQGWVQCDNEQLVSELKSASEGGVSAGPQARTAKFSKLVEDDFSNAIRRYEDVESLIYEIVTEGEGSANFQERSKQMLQEVDQAGGPAGFWRALHAKDCSAGISDAMLLRNSHAYRFAMILRGLAREQAIDHEFRPARAQVTVAQSVRLRQFTNELPQQFNACYLVLLAWLSRMYETENWNQDTRRRRAIEQLAMWPMMSMAIRPFLELASFLPIQDKMLFRTDAAGLPALPVYARQLAELFAGADWTQAKLEQMDLLVVRTLGATAAWARYQKEAVEGASIQIPEPARSAILTRLHTLHHLDEFAEQLRFRSAGGYSNQLPDVAYQRKHPDAQRYSEDPSLLGNTALFEDSLVLRLRFSGWASLQMATDFDPPAEEAGCTGSVFLRCSDGPGKRLNRALRFQATETNGVILREPRDQLPTIGVNVVDIGLLVTQGPAKAGYHPVKLLRPAITTQAQAHELVVEGLAELWQLDARKIETGPIQMELQSKENSAAHLVGQNHLVWQNGEPIDPFVLAVQGNVPNGAGPAQVWLEREVFNEGKSILQMSPLERLYTARWMFGGTPNGDVPAWVPQEQMRVTDTGSYQKARAQALGARLDALLDDQKDTQAWTDETVSLAERLATLCGRWLAAHTHYGHTISGKRGNTPEVNDLFTAIGCQTGLQLKPTADKSRGEANGRWLASYNLASYDPDAMACLVYGELYVPVEVAETGETVRFSRKWRLPAEAMQALVKVGCDFSRGMTGQVAESEGVRRAQFEKLTLHETRGGVGADWYEYTVAGIAGVTSMKARFQAMLSGEDAELQWDSEIITWAASGTIQALTYVGACMEGITARLTQHFGPR